MEAARIALDIERQLRRDDEALVGRSHGGRLAAVMLAFVLLLR